MPETPPPRILIRGGTVISMEDAAASVGADILIEGSTIAAIGQDLAVDGPHEVIDAAGQIVLPGFVDTHRHMWQGAIKGVAGDKTFGEYFGAVNAGIATRYRAEDIEIGVELAALEALDAGVTTILDWAHAATTPDHADASVDALERVGIRGVFAYGPPAGDVGAWWTDSTLTHPEDAARVRRERLSDDEALVTMALALRGPEFSTIETVAKDIAFARELGLRSTMHIGIPGLHHRYAGIATMAKHELLGPDLTYVHGNAFGPDDLRMIADSGGTLSVSPEVEAQMGFGFPPLRAMLDAGVRPSLSVDVPTGIEGSILAQARHLLQVSRALDNAVHLSAGEAPPRLRISSWDALEFATVRGAAALGLQDRIGTLTPGKQADIVVLDARSWNLFPVNDAVSQVVLTAHAGNVRDVLVAGRVQKRDGALVDTATHAELRERALRSRDHALGTD